MAVWVPNPNAGMKKNGPIEKGLVIAKEGGWGGMGWGGVGWGGGLEVWDEQMQTTTYRMDKRKGPAVRHRKLYSVSGDKPEYTYTYAYI